MTAAALSGCAQASELLGYEPFLKPLIPFELNADHTFAFFHGDYNDGPQHDNYQVVDYSDGCEFQIMYK